MANSAYSPEPPLDESSAQFYVDLVAALAGLRFAGVDYFYKPRLNTSQAANTQMFAGARQARNYLLEFRFTQELCQAILLNPLFDKVRPNPARLTHLIGESAFYDFEFARDGQELGHGAYRLKLLGVPFCIEMVRPFVERICNFQSLMATTGVRELASQKSLVGDRFSFAGTVEASAIRMPNPTMSAYVARARHVAGYLRWSAHRLPKVAESAKVRPKEDLAWRVRWRVLEARQNRRELIQRTGCFTDAEVKQLLNGRITGLSEAEYVRDDLYGYALDGVPRHPRIYFRPGKFIFRQTPQQLPLKAENGVLLIDTCYQEVISPGSLGDTPLYGDGSPTHTREGQAIEDLLHDFSPSSTVRARYSRIPRFQVASMGELERVVDRLRDQVPDGRLLFRGQFRHFSVGRSRLANQLLYGDPEVDEVSVLTTASRHGFDFDHFSGRLQLDLQGFLYHDLDSEAFKQHGVDREGTVHFANIVIGHRHYQWTTVSEHWETIVMGIAQHYGVPTNGLDLTSDVRIALWMAFHGWNGKEWARLLDDQLSPVIYLISPMGQTEAEASVLPGISSLRQQRQSAHLHFGGWGWHTNLCGEDLLAILDLAPQFTSDLHDPKWVFPPPEEDPLLAFLLEIKRRHVERGKPWGYERIV